MVTRSGKCRHANESFVGCNWDHDDRPADIDDAVARQKSACGRDHLNEQSWKIINTEISGLLNKIQDSKQTLGEILDGRLHYGIKTGCNAVFEIDQQQYEDFVADDPASAEIIRPWLRGRNIGRWDVEWANQYLIFTRRGIEIEKYPAVYKYLKKHRERLKPRPKDVPAKGWPGRKPGSYKWYEIQDAIDYWREFDKPKILYQEIATYQQFAYTTNKFVANNKVFIIPDPPKGLLAILNSKVVWFFLNQISAKLQYNALAMQSPYVQRIPFATPTSTLIRLEKNLMEQDRDTISGMQETCKLELEIDKAVLKLYGLNSSDEKVIDESLLKEGNRFSKSFKDSDEYKQYVAENFE